MREIEFITQIEDTFHIDIDIDTGIVPKRSVLQRRFDSEGKTTPSFRDYLLGYLESGQVTGRRALEIFHHYRAENEYYHGTPLSRSQLTGGELRSYQSTWSDEYGNSYADGYMGIAVDKNYEFPIVRSLLHNAAPIFQDKDCHILSVRKDALARHKAILITSKEAVDTVSETHAIGYVHSLKSPNNDNLIEFHRNEERIDEARIFFAIRPFLEIAVTHEDLPDDLVVIDADKRKIASLVGTNPYVDIPQLLGRANSEGITVKPLRGYWPLRYHPRLR